MTINFFFFYFQNAEVNDKKAEPSALDKLKNLNKQDIVRANDFNFLTVLGKGSFGKVSIFLYNFTGIA